MATSTAKKPAPKKAKASEGKTTKAKSATTVKQRFDLHKSLQEHFGFNKFKGTRKKQLNP